MEYEVAFIIFLASCSIQNIQAECNVEEIRTCVYPLNETIYSHMSKFDLWVVANEPFPLVRDTSISSVCSDFEVAKACINGINATDCSYIEEEASKYTAYIETFDFICADTQEYIKHASCLEGAGTVYKNAAETCASNSYLDTLEATSHPSQECRGLYQYMHCMDRAASLKCSKHTGHYVRLVVMKYNLARDEHFGCDLDNRWSLNNAELISLTFVTVITLLVLIIFTFVIDRCQVYYHRQRFTHPGQIKPNGTEIGIYHDTAPMESSTSHYRPYGKHVPLREDLPRRRVYLESKLAGNQIEDISQFNKLRPTRRRPLQSLLLPQDIGSSSGIDKKPPKSRSKSSRQIYQLPRVDLNESSGSTHLQKKDLQ